MEQLNTPTEVILGVDTHLDVHVGVVIDAVGRVKGTLSIETKPSGYEWLLIWARSFGRLDRAGIEGTGSYGADLTRFLESKGVAVVEINRPNLPVDDYEARATRPMQRARRGPCWPTMQPVSRRPGTAWLRPCAR